MEGKITWKKDFKKGAYMVILKLSNGVSATVYLVKGFRNETNWSSFKIGDAVSGLVWFNEQKKLIDADSPVHPLE